MEFGGLRHVGKEPANKLWACARDDHARFAPAAHMMRQRQNIFLYKLKESLGYRRRALFDP